MCLLILYNLRVQLCTLKIREHKYKWGQVKGNIYVLYQLENNNWMCLVKVDINSTRSQFFIPIYFFKNILCAYSQTEN